MFTLFSWYDIARYIPHFKVTIFHLLIFGICILCLPFRILCVTLYSHAVYGWKDTFPIEVRKGGTLILTVGYLKGKPLDRILFGVNYDTNGERNSLLVCLLHCNSYWPDFSDASVDRTSFTLGTEDEQLEVTVLDDGQPVLDDRTITITLVRVAGGSTHDIIISEATLIIPASMLSLLWELQLNGVTIHNRVLWVKISHRAAM